MIIQEFPVACGDFENPATQAANDGVCRQQIIALDSILIAAKLNADHDCLRGQHRTRLRQLQGALEPSEIQLMTTGMCGSVPDLPVLPRSMLHVE
jgi:hypothetical protein